MKRLICSIIGHRTEIYGKNILGESLMICHRCHARFIVTAGRFGVKEVGRR